MWHGGSSEANKRDKNVVFMKYSCIPSAFIGLQIENCNRGKNAGMLFNIRQCKRFFACILDCGYCGLWIPEKAY